MDSGGAEVVYCNGTKPSVPVDPKEEVDKLKDEEGKNRSLLLLAVNGGLADNRKESSKGNVRWKDHNGGKLVEAFEFQPSDSSGSENDSGCICNMM